MRREQDRHPLAAIDLAKEVAHAVLGDHVESDRRLVEVQDLGVVQQRRCEIAAHALTERQLAHGRTQKRVEIEQLAHTANVVRVALGRHTINVAQQLERIDQRQIPPQLCPLAEHDADALSQLLASAVRHHTQHLHLSAARDQNARQHLDGGRLARPVRAQTADHLAAVDRERHVAHGADLAILAHDERGRRTEQPRALLRDAKGLLQPLDVNHHARSAACALVVPHALLPAETG